MKIFDEIFHLKNFRRPISKFSNYGSNKRFRSKFCAKLCRIHRRRPWSRNPIESREWEACTKKSPSRNVCPRERLSFRRAYHMRTNTKLLIPGTEVFFKITLFEKSTDRHGIGSERSLTCPNHHKTHTRSKLYDSPVILRPIRASSAR